MADSRPPSFHKVEHQPVSEHLLLATLVIEFIEQLLVFEIDICLGDLCLGLS